VLAELIRNYSLVGIAMGWMARATGTRDFFLHYSMQTGLDYQSSSPMGILKELPVIGIKYLIQLFNSVLLNRYFPAQWEVAQIILILKPGKPEELTSYRPISLLPIVSKVFEKLLFKRLLPIVEINRLIPNH
jgi:hypothetical protein